MRMISRSCRVVSDEALRQHFMNNEIVKNIENDGKSESKMKREMNISAHSLFYSIYTK